jgi:hypothetical protein
MTAGTLKEPKRYPAGISYVFVNGVAIVANGRPPAPPLQRAAPEVDKKRMLRRLAGPGSHFKPDEFRRVTPLNLHCDFHTHGNHSSVARRVN